MSGATSGPWVVNAMGDRVYAGPRHIATLGPDGNLYDTILLAEAPQLLAALKSLLALEACDSDEPKADHAWAQARAVVAKAEARR